MNIESQVSVVTTYRNIFMNAFLCQSRLEIGLQCK